MAHEFPFAHLPHYPEGATQPVTAIQAFRAYNSAYGLPFYVLDPENAADVNVPLTEYGIYTTSEPHEPGSLWTFSRDRDQQRVLEGIADQTIESAWTVARDDPEYASILQERRLGSHFAHVFGAVTGIDGYGVRVEDLRFNNHGKAVDGTARARSMVFAVGSVSDVRPLSTAFQTLLFSPYRRYPVHEYSRAVEVRGMTEHTARSIARATGALLAREDKEQGWTLHPEKWSWERLRAWGATFHPGLERRLSATAQAYQRLEIRAAHGEGHILHDVRKQPHPLVTDAAAVFQGMRDVFNEAIEATFEEGTGRNPELPADPKERLAIDMHANLVRDRIAPAVLAKGPATPRTRYLTEMGQRAVAEMWEEAQRHPIRTFARAVTLGLGVVGIGLESALGTVLKLEPGARQQGMQAYNDIRDWRQAKADAAASRQRVNDALQDLVVHEIGQTLAR